MSLEENKAVVRRMFEESYKGNLAVIDELFASNYVLHRAGGRGVHGRDEMKQTHTMLFSTFPDLHWTVEDVMAEGDKVATRATLAGTHKGEWLGFAPTGKRVTVTQIAIRRIVAGKIVETWEETFWEIDSRPVIDLDMQMKAMSEALRR